MQVDGSHWLEDKLMLQHHLTGQLMPPEILSLNKSAVISGFGLEVSQQICHLLCHDVIKASG